MLDVQILTAPDTMVLPDQAIDAFRQSLRGTLLLRRDAGYDEARRTTTP
jgi:hypothetical protein